MTPEAQLAWVVIGIVSAVGLVLGVILRVRRRRDRAPRVPGVGSNALLFFHSPTCGPCRVMQPHVEALAARDHRVHLVDVSVRPDMARAYDVRATPTLVAIRRGSITDVRMGVQSPQAMAGMLP